MEDLFGGGSWSAKIAIWISNTPNSVKRDTEVGNGLTHTSMSSVSNRSPVFGSYALYPGNPVLVLEAAGQSRSVSRMTACVYSSLFRIYGFCLIVFGVSEIGPRILSCSFRIRTRHSGFLHSMYAA